MKILNHKLSIMALAVLALSNGTYATELLNGSTLNQVNATTAPQIFVQDKAQQAQEGQKDAQPSKIFKVSVPKEDPNPQDLKIADPHGPLTQSKQEVDTLQTTLASLLGFKEQDPRLAKENLSELKNILSASSPLPVKSLMAIEANGNLVLISENQRFIFKGQIYDVFNNMRELKNVEDIKNYAFKIDYSLLGLDPETLNTAKIGNGPLKVIVYVDPLSENTRKIMSEVMELPDLENYSFYFVIMPSLTEESKEAALKFYCARENGNLEAGNLLYQGKLASLETTQCDLTNWDRTMAVAFYTGVDVLPLFIGTDGRITRGIPSEGLKAWLASQPQIKQNSNLKDLESKKEIEEQVVKQALEQEAQAQINAQEKAQATTSASSEPNNPFANLDPVNANTNAVPLGTQGLYTDPDDYQALQNGRFAVRAQTLKERFEKELDRLERREISSKNQYEAILRRSEGAWAQAQNYPDEKRQQARERLERKNQAAYDEYQQDLKDLNDRRLKLQQDYQDDLRKLRQKQNEVGK